MKRLSLALMLIAGTLTAQYYPDRRYNGPPRGEVFDRAQSDLSRAAQHSYDRRRIEHAQREISNFQRKLSYGHFSSRDLDKAINATDDVFRRGAIAPPDRDNIYRDLENMRAFRANAR